MPELIPFRCYYYKNGQDPKILRNLVSPPYDVISKEHRNYCLNRNRYNICHVILPDNYDDAGIKLKEMINKEILTLNDRKCIYIYGIEYINPENEKRMVRYGFVGLLKLAEIFPASDGILPHEMTFKKFTEDRLQIIRRTDANFSPIFTIYNGKGLVNKIYEKYIHEKPFLETIDRDGFIHKIWKVNNSDDIKVFQEIVKRNSIIIADGHHRYITSLRRSKEGGCKYIMALFIDFNDPGLIIYTSHRLVKNLKVGKIKGLKNAVNKFFDIKEKFFDLKELQEELKKSDRKTTFGCFFQDSFLLFKLKKNIKPEDHIPGNHSIQWKRLGLSILHYILFKKCLNVDEDDISFIKDVSEGINRVKKNQGNAALFIVNPTTLEDIHEITRLGEIMPQKSTYFYPKPLSGLIIHIHSNEVE